MHSISLLWYKYKFIQISTILIYSSQFIHTIWYITLFLVIYTNSNKNRQNTKKIKSEKKGFPSSPQIFRNSFNNVRNKTKIQSQKTKNYIWMPSEKREYTNFIDSTGDVVAAWRVNETQSLMWWAMYFCFSFMTTWNFSTTEMHSTDKIDIAASVCIIRVNKACDLSYWACVQYTQAWCWNTL